VRDGDKNLKKNSPTTRWSRKATNQSLTNKRPQMRLPRTEQNFRKSCLRKAQKIILVQA